MGIVTVGAVFHDRRVLPQKWPAALGVAAVTVFVDGRLQQLAGIGAAMRIVAAGAGDLAFAIGHVRRAQQLGAAHFVTLQAELGLGLFSADMLSERRAKAGLVLEGGFAPGSAPIVHLMAVDAGHGARLVRAAAPE